MNLLWSLLFFFSFEHFGIFYTIKYKKDNQNVQKQKVGETLKQIVCNILNKNTQLTYYCLNG